jgi:hypothetical protein
MEVDLGAANEGIVALVQYKGGAQERSSDFAARSWRAPAVS